MVATAISAIIRLYNCVSREVTGFPIQFRK